MKYGILGGGLSGLTLQKHLACESEILEKESALGGLGRSFCKDGFTYDLGGHILFSTQSHLVDYFSNLLKDNLLRQRRANFVLYKDRMVKYPFENGLGGLEKQDIFECLTAFLNNPHPKPQDFAEWIYYTFGSGIAEKYLLPYNQKIWKTSPEKMSLGWVERVPRPPVEDVIRSALGIETEGYTHQLNFLYPRQGGIESVVHGTFSSQKKNRLSFAVKSITKSADGWGVSDGESVRNYEKIVITFPIKDAVAAMSQVPHDVRSAVNNLKHNRIRIVLVGLKDERFLNKSAVYIPDPQRVFHRLCYMGYFSPNNVPTGSSSLIAEVTTNESCPEHHMSDDSLIERTVYDLEQMGWLKASEVATVDIQNRDYGYVVYDHKYQENINKVTSYFSSLGIPLLGRFAQWEYINMDEVVRRSLEMAERLNHQL